MSSSTGSRDLQHIFDAIASTGYNVTPKLKIEIQTKCFESKSSRQFFDEFAKTVSSKNVMSVKEQKKYKELVAKNKTTNLPKKDVLLAEVKDLEIKGSKLDAVLLEAENEKRKLQLQLSAMNDLKAQSDNKNKLLQSAVKQTTTKLGVVKKENKLSLQEYWELLGEMKKICSKINRHFAKNTGYPTKIADLSFDKCVEVEREFLAILTKYAKKLFTEETSLFIDQSILELSHEENFSNISTENLQNKKSMEAIEIDIKRGMHGYAPRKENLIFGLAELEESNAKLNFINQHLNIDSANFRNNELKNEFSETSSQIKYLKNDVLPQLLKRGTELEKNIFLFIDFRHELAEKKYFTNKQLMVIKLLNEQCGRFSAVSMLLKLEDAETKYISNILRKLFKLLKSEQNNSEMRLSLLVNNNKQDKEGAKAVIDKRDGLMLSFYDLLEIKGNSMFPTFLSVHQAIEDLKTQEHKNDNEKDALITALKQLNNALMLCYEPLHCASGVTCLPLSIIQTIESLKSNADEMNLILQNCVAKMEEEKTAAGKI